MTINNQAGQNDNSQNEGENGYTYSYPRPSEVQPPQNQPGTGNPYDPNHRARNPYNVAGQTSNYPYPLPNNPADPNLPPFYAPPGQTFQPNNGPHQNPYTTGSLYDADSQPPPQPTLQTRGLAIPLYRPLWTNIILGAIIAVFVLQIFKDGGLEGLASSFSNQTLYDLGALQANAVQRGEWWRLFTVMFLHANAVHILFNGYALYLIGRQLEAYYGSTRLVLIYFLCGLSGGIASFGLNLHGNELAVGASGAIFGLFGALAAFFGRNRRQLGSAGARQFQSLLILIVINLVIGASIPNIDNLAHMGGLVSGLILGYVLSPVYERSTLSNGEAVIKDTSRPLTWAMIGAGWLVLEVAVFFYFLNRV